MVSNSQQIDSQKHQQSLITAQADEPSRTELKQIINKQRQQIHLLVEEQKETHELIETLYLKDQANIKEIQVLTRALQLKAKAENETIPSLKELALISDVNLHQEELNAVLQVQISGLTQQNKELVKQINDLKTIRELNNQELIDVESERHKL